MSIAGRNGFDTLTSIQRVAAKKTHSMRKLAGNSHGMVLWCQNDTLRFEM